MTTLHRAGWDHPHPGQTPRPSQHPLWSCSVTPGHLSLLMFRKLSFWDHKIIFPSFTALISPLKSPAIYLPIYLSPLSLPSLLQQLPVLPWDGPHCLTLQHELSARSTTTQMDTASCIPHHVLHPAPHLCPAQWVQDQDTSPSHRCHQRVPGQHHGRGESSSLSLRKPAERAPEPPRANPAHAVLRG